LPPISTIGFGFTDVSSANLEPFPPARIATFIKKLLALLLDLFSP
jgi:hypothetical protein